MTERFPVRTKIDTLPFIGVMLVALIAFVALVPSMTGHGPLLPQARTGVIILPQGVTLAIDRYGGFHLRSGDALESLLPPPRLTSKLAEAYAGRPDDHVLYLLADRDAPYALVLTAVGAARETGVERLEILTDVPREPRAHP